VYCKFKDGEDNLLFRDLRHYLPEKFLLYVASDPFIKWSFSGLVAHIALNLGEGSFREGRNYDHKDDVFAIAAGSQLIPDDDDNLVP